MIEEFSDRSNYIFKLAHDLAIKQNHTLISHHILYALIENPDKYIVNILRNIGADISALKKKLKKYLSQLKIEQSFNPNAKINYSVIKLVDIAKLLIQENGDKVVTQEILFLALAHSDMNTKVILSSESLTFERLKYEI